MDFNVYEVQLPTCTRCYDTGQVWSHTRKIFYPCPGVNEHLACVCGRPREYSGADSGAAPKVL